MRVLMVLGRSSGGIGAHVDTLTQELRSLGHEVRIVTDTATAEHFGWADADRLWPLRGGTGLARSPLDWHRIMGLARASDVVHAHGHQAALVAAPAVLRSRPRPGFVVSLHNDLPPEPTALISRAGSGAVRWALHRADLVTGASPDLVALAREAGARAVELATVASPRVAALLAEGPLGPVGPGPDPQPGVPGAPVGSGVSGVQPLEQRRHLLDEVGIEDPGNPLVLTVSRIAPQKDLATLVRAAAQSQCPATWVVVGGGDEELRARLEAEVGGMPNGGAGAVHFVGPRDDVTPWLRAADVFVLSSRWEARALVVQEAMAAGLPVVATHVGGLPDLLAGTGLLVPPGDPVALAAAVDEVLGDPGRAAERGAAARREAASWATPEQEARRWGDRYATLLRR